MTLARIAAALAPLVLVAAAPPLPDLKVEATDGGSLLRIRNTAQQPLTAYLIELVGYPGSSWAFYQEGAGAWQVAPGAQRDVPSTNMTVGAAPEYVKMQAALFLDGSAAGTPEKVEQLVALRRSRLETMRGLIARLRKGGDKAALAGALREWQDSIPVPTRSERGKPSGVTRTLAREQIAACLADLEKRGTEEVLATLTAAEKALAASRPPL